MISDDRLRSELLNGVEMREACTATLIMKVYDVGAYRSKKLFKTGKAIEGAFIFRRSRRKTFELWKNSYRQTVDVMKPERLEPRWILVKGDVVVYALFT